MSDDVCTGARGVPGNGEQLEREQLAGSLVIDAK